MTRRLLLRNADVLVTMDDQRREITDGAILIEDHVIVAVGTSAELAVQVSPGTETLDMKSHVVMPGMVNTHHHMMQSLTRALPAAQNADLFGWLKALYPVWANLTPEAARIGAKTAMAELILSGCTTSSDHHYLYTDGVQLDDDIQAAQEIGLRFHAARGSMSIGQSQGGLPPDRIVEREDHILRDTQRLIEKFNDQSRHAMTRVVVAPCSPFTVSQNLMRESARLARSYGVRLHTHLAENDDDVVYTRERFACTPAEYAEALGWTGPDVWHAHCVKLDEDGIVLFGKTKTGIAHCPCSNMRLASGIAPIGTMRRAGVPVGLGVDGSASNDSGHMLGEARQAMLLARVGFGPAAMSAREALEIATRGGAEVLGRDDIGQLAPRMSADVIAFDTRSIGFAGAQTDQVAGLVFCTPAQVALSIINGRIIVREGIITTLDLAPHLEQHRRMAIAIARGERI
jgi:cytosine/adenosine deaminase-related metal-dependent hydrolase